MSCHDETWNKCRFCKKTIKDWHYYHGEKGCIEHRPKIMESTTEGALEAFKTIVENFNPGYNKICNCGCIVEGQKHLHQSHIHTSNGNFLVNHNGRARLSWEETALRLAFNIAKYRSEDPYVQVGATIIKNDGSILLGYNGAPSGQEIDWSNRDNRRERVIHSEENVLTWVKPGEVKIMACTALPCKVCMKTIAHKKIPRLIYRDELEGYDNNFSKKLAKEFGIELVKLEIIL